MVTAVLHTRARGAVIASDSLPAGATTTRWFGVGSQAASSVVSTSAAAAAFPPAPALAPAGALSAGAMRIAMAPTLPPGPADRPAPSALPLPPVKAPGKKGAVLVSVRGTPAPAPAAPMRIVGKKTSAAAGKAAAIATGGEDLPVASTAGQGVLALPDKGGRSGRACAGVRAQGGAQGEAEGCAVG